jgi:hypothetical protein
MSLDSLFTLLRTRLISPKIVLGWLERGIRPVLGDYP